MPGFTGNCQGKALIPGISWQIKRRAEAPGKNGRRNMSVERKKKAAFIFRSKRSTGPGI